MGEALLRALGWGDGKEGWLPVGVGIHAGLAFVGKVGHDGLYDVTALGDTVNTAARLQAEAKPGEIVLSEAIYKDASEDYPDLEFRVVNVRGREEPVAVRVLRP